MSSHRLGSISWIVTGFALALISSGCGLDDGDIGLTDDAIGAEILHLHGTPTSGVQGPPLVEFPDTGPFTRIHPTKMAIGKDRKIYFNSSAAIVYRVDEDGTLETVTVLPNAGGIPDDDFTIGITFDRRGDLFVSNATGVFKISRRDLRPDVLAGPVPNTKIADIPPDLLFAMGLTAGKRGNLYLSDIFGGAIYEIDKRTGDVELWFSDPALLAPNVVPSDNLFGFGFGITDITIDGKGKYLYFGTQETHRIYRLGINRDGSAGALEELAHVPQLAFNGVSFDRVTKEVYLSVPWEKFENGIQTPDPVTVGGSIWVIDVKKLKRDGFATPVKLIDDDAVGAAVDVVRGTKFGHGNRDRLYVTDSSLDTFFWLNGDPNGTPLPDPTPEAGFPFPQNVYHGAVRVIELD